LLNQIITFAQPLWSANYLIWHSFISITYRTAEFSMAMRETWHVTSKHRPQCQYQMPPIREVPGSDCVVRRASRNCSRDISPRQICLPVQVAWPTWMNRSPELTCRPINLLRHRMADRTFGSLNWFLRKRAL